MLSYAQHFEDVYLMRCFGEQRDGFYIDVGAGHPVIDNVSFAFYLRGWRGITVEPNPSLARLSRHVRPRDTAVETLVGAKPGEAKFYLVDDFHGLSTMIGETPARPRRITASARTSTCCRSRLSPICARHTARMRSIS